MIWRYEKLSQANEKGEQEGREVIAPQELIRLLESKRGTIPNGYIVNGLSINGKHLVISFTEGGSDESYLDRLETRYFINRDIGIKKCVHMGRRVV